MIYGRWLGAHATSARHFFGCAPIVWLGPDTATVKSIDPHAFMEQAGSDYVPTVRVWHAGSTIMTHAVGMRRVSRQTSFTLFTEMPSPTASVSSGSLGQARFRVLSPCSERPFVALSCLDTLWQEVSSRAIYVSDAVGLALRRYWHVGTGAEAISSLGPFSSPLY